MEECSANVDAVERGFEWSVSELLATSPPASGAWQTKRAIASSRTSSPPWCASGWSTARCERRVSRNPDGPENPLSDEELEVKFRTNTKPTLPTNRVEELRATLNTLDELDSVDNVVRHLRG